DQDTNVYPHQTWLVTEAWWASNIRPPSLGTTVRWLAHDLGRVVDAVKQASNARRSATRGDYLIATDGPGWTRAIDTIKAWAVPTLIGLLWLVGGAVATVYAFLRGLPLIGDKVAIAQLDTFLIDWFGDLRVLLHDQSQAANIRDRLVDNPYRFYPKLKWFDFWGTYDPAPAGQFDRAPVARPRQGVPDGAPDPRLTLPDHPFAPDRSHAVWNRMSFHEDHGGYWDNDEEFIIPLVQEIETAAGGPTPSRFFRSEDEQRTRVVRRIERVAALGWWRFLAAVATVASL